MKREIDTEIIGIEKVKRDDDSLDHPGDIGNYTPG
jgi:hypothetical protein